MNVSAEDLDVIARALQIVASLKRAGKPKRARFAAGGEAEGEGDAEGDGEGAQTEGGDPSGGDPAAGDSPDSGEGGGPASGGPDPSGAQSDAGAQQQDGQQQEADPAGAAQAAAAAAAAATQDDTTQAPGVSAAGALGGYSNVSRDNRAGGFGFGDFSGGFGSHATTVGDEPTEPGNVVSGARGGFGISGAGLSGAGIPGATGGLAGFDNFGAQTGAGVGPSTAGFGSGARGVGFDPNEGVGAGLPEGYGVAPGYGAGAGKAASVTDDGVMDPAGHVNLNIPVGDLVERGGKPTSDDLPSANPGRNGWAGPGATSDIGPWGNNRDNVVGRGYALSDAMVNAGLGPPTRAGVAAVLGNLGFESGGNQNSPTGVNWGANNPAGGNYGAVGAAGWRGDRAEALAGKMGFDSPRQEGFKSALDTSANTQLGHVADEIANPSKAGLSPAAMSQLAGLMTATGRVNQTTREFMEGYEKPSKTDQAKSLGARQELARGFLDAMNKAEMDYGLATWNAGHGAPVAGGLAYGQTGAGVFSGPNPASSPNLAAGVGRGQSPAQADIGQERAAAAAAAQATPGLPQGELSGPAVDAVNTAAAAQAAANLGAALAAGRVEEPGDPIGANPFGDLSPMGGRPSARANDLNIDMGYGSLVSNNPAMQGVATGYAGMGMKTDYPGAITSELVGFDNLGATLGGLTGPSIVDTARQEMIAYNDSRRAAQPGISPGSLTTTGPMVENVQMPPGRVTNAVGKIGAGLVAGAVPGLGLANLASGLLGGPTVGKALGSFFGGQDLALNGAVTGRNAQTGLASSGSTGGGERMVVDTRDPLLDQKPAQAEATIGYAPDNKTAADLAYEAAMAFRPAGVRVGTKPKPYLTAGLVPSQPSATQQLYANLGIPS